MIKRREGPWCKIAFPVDRMFVTDAGEHIAPSFFRVDQVEPGGLRKHVGRRCTLTARLRAGEKSGRAAERHVAKAVPGPSVYNDGRNPRTIDA